MISRILLIVQSDPRTSGRPAEAIRIAAGVSTWKSVEMLLYFRGAGVLALSGQTGCFIDEDHYTRYLPLLAEAQSPFYAEAEALLLKEIQAAVPFQQISQTQLAELLAGCRSVACF